MLVDNYIKIHATIPNHRPIHAFWPYQTGTDSEAEAIRLACEAREFHSSNGWKARLSVWRRTPASEKLRTGVVGQGIGMLAREWCERAARTAPAVLTAADAAKAGAGEDMEDDDA